MRRTSVRPGDDYFFLTAAFADAALFPPLSRRSGRAAPVKKKIAACNKKAGMFIPAPREPPLACRWSLWRNPSSGSTGSSEVTRQIPKYNMSVRLARFEMPSRLTKDESTATDTYSKFIAEPFEGGYARSGERMDLEPITSGHGVSPKRG